MLENAQKEWLTAREVAKLMTSQSDFEITPPFVQRLSREGKLKIWPINRQMYLYSRESVERYLDERKKQPQRA